MAKSKTPLSLAHVNLSHDYAAAERQTVLLIKHLASAGISQMLICRSSSLMLSKLKGTANLRILKIDSPDPRFKGHFKAGRRYKYVHAHDARGAEWALVHYMICGTPYILSIRSSEFSLSFLIRRALAWTCAAAVPSESIARKIAPLTRAMVTIIPNSISSLLPYKPSVLEIRTKYSERFIVGMAAPLINRQKCQSDLIDAARLLRNRLPTLVVLLIGDGSDKKLLHQRAEGMSNIKFVNAGYSALADYLGALDAYVTPIAEGDGNDILNLLDAMDLGVPVISTQYEGSEAHVRHFDNALVVEKNNPEQLAEAIFALKSDPALASRLAQAGREEAQKSSPKNMTEEYLNLYKAVDAGL